MNSKHRKTLQAIFATPPPKGLQWAEVEALLVSLGAVVTEGNGSRVKFEIQRVTIAIHRPHNPKTVRAYLVPILKKFFQDIGVRP